MSEAYLDLNQINRDIDLVILATPLSSFASIVKEISPNLKDGCVITDTGSYGDVGFGTAYTLDFQATQKHYEYEYVCSVGQYEFNNSMNMCQKQLYLSWSNTFNE